MNPIYMYIATIISLVPRPSPAPTGAGEGLGTRLTIIAKFKFATVTELVLWLTKAIGWSTTMSFF